MVTTVALSGAGGLIGRAVAARLAESGHAVRALRHGGALPAPSAPSQAFREALAGADLVVHCAALNSDRGTSPQALDAANGVLTARLAEAAAEMPGCGFIYLSSTRAVADSGVDCMIGPDTPPRPTGAYGRSKLLGETGVREAFGVLGNRRAFILRLPMVYGQGMRGLLGLLLRLARSPLPLPLGGLKGVRPLLGLDKAVGAILHLAGLSPAPLRTLVAADAEPLSLSEIATAFRAGLGRRPGILGFPPPAFGPLRALQVRQACDVSALAALGWEPRTDTPAALAALAAGKRP